DPGNTVGSLIYDNSLYGTNPGMTAGIVLNNVPTAKIKNNILSGMQYAYNIDPGSTTGTTVDYDDVNGTDATAPAGTWGATLYNFAGWQGLGHDTNGVNANPLW